MLGQLFHEAYGAGAGGVEQPSTPPRFSSRSGKYSSTRTDPESQRRQLPRTTTRARARVADAQAWLNNLGSFTDNYDVALLSNESHQDFVMGTKRTGRDVPGARVDALLAAGLCGDDRRFAAPHAEGAAA